MARLRLRTQLLVATLTVICGLMGALLFTVRHVVSLEIDREIKENTDASRRAFENIQRQREFQLSRTAALLAELPNLKALMSTEHEATIQDASEPLWKLTGSDLFLLADPSGQVMGFHVKTPGWKPAFVEADLKRSMQQDEDDAWWYGDGQLYWVFLYPITAGTNSDARRLGVVAVGYRVDSSVADELALAGGTKIALAAGDMLIASTLSSHEEGELQHWIGKPHPSNSDERKLTLDSGDYVVASVVVHAAPPAQVQFYILTSLKPSNEFIQQLNRIVFLIGFCSVIIATLLLTFVSRTITKPLDNLVGGVRALAAGDYTYSITPRQSSEVAELGLAFSKMRADLLESRQRWLTAERIAALGRAANLISHDLRHHLATIVANAEFLYEADRLKLDRSEIYDEIKIASDQMTDLLDSLRELAKGEVTINPISCSLDLTIRRAIESVLARPELRSRSISVARTGEMEGVFDPKRIERAFFNLILNACEAMEHRQGQISVDIISSEDLFEVRLRDNGPGVPAAIIDTLFNPFVSLGKPNGTGLGLAIVNKIFQEHHGSVVVETTSEAGTVFLVKLPRSLQIANVDAKPVVA